MVTEKSEKRINDRNSSHMLMREFVKREADDVARSFEEIVPALRFVSYEALEKSMSVVNQTFASVALQLISHNSNLEPDDPNNMVLPVGADQMREALEELSKFIHCTSRLLWLLHEKHNDDPAIKLANEVFAKYDYDVQM